MTYAQTTKDHLEGISKAATSIPPGIEEIKTRSDQGISEQTAIIEEAQGILEKTSEVKDIVPWWANLLEITMIAVSLVAVVIILWNTGIGLAIRKVIGLIPEAKKDQAKFLMEALNGNTDLKESVAFMRAKDPLLDSAFKRRKEQNAKLQANSSTTDAA